MYKIKPQKVVYVIPTVFGLMALSVIVFFILFLFAKIENDSKILSASKNNADTIKIESDQIEDFKNNYKYYKPNLDRIDQLYVNPNDPVDFIKFLEDTANSSQIKSNISLTSNLNNDKTKKEDHNSVTFQFFSSEDFLKILDFTDKLENGPYLVQIKNLVINNSQQDITSKDYPPGKVDATFLIKVFIKP